MSTPSSTHSPTPTVHTPTLPSATIRQRRAAAALLILGVIAYILPTALHGNPPIDDAAATLDYVRDRGLWTIAHFANVGAVMMWAAAVALLKTSGMLGQGRGAVAQVAWGIAGGAFAIYYGIHAVGLWSAANQLDTVARDLVLERTESLLLILGSSAFVAQAVLGVAVALFGLALIGTTRASRILGAVGIVTGTGWCVGALLINFGIIVPFTTLGWAWAVAVALVVFRAARHSA
ncbi:MAG TPA: hypothetical protein H9870_12265 [Candidatus Corynebacterium avicola]|uniref:DUF4386 family protein n=1 Tax=Candidatus Corynebacterium avicola TaxID=2838527 RepID=A0A9D1RQM7_9CORY|nr:hypothetical protein [Candidatus Corynebacterium avicola]